MSSFLKTVKDNISKIIVGKDNVIDLLLTALLCKGHVIIEDVPGVGKTTLVWSLAKSIGCSFNRIQFTPDVLPSDITGFSMVNMKTGDLEFKKGAVFSNILLADEINRTPPKTQSALLEAMQEQQVTTDGISRALPSPFMVLATQNPIEYIGTYPLPEAQLDRFFMRITIGYPSVREEMNILSRFTETDPKSTLKEVVSSQEIIEAQSQVEKIECAEKIYEYVATIAMQTRQEEHIRLGVSPRGSLCLINAAKANAYLHGRSYVIPDDVQEMIYPVFEHRIILKPEAKLYEMNTRRVLRNILNTIKVPVI